MDCRLCEYTALGRHFGCNLGLLGHGLQLGNESAFDIPHGSALILCQILKVVNLRARDGVLEDGKNGLLPEAHRVF
jgi:hypothetical protein